MASSVLVDKGNNSKVTAKLIEYFLKLDSTKLLDSSTHNNNNNNWPPDIDRTQLASAYCNICTGILQFPTWEMPTEPTCSLYCYWRVQSQLTVLERWCEPSVIINEQGWPPQLAITVFCDIVLALANEVFHTVSSPKFPHMVLVDPWLWNRHLPKVPCAWSPIAAEINSRIRTRCLVILKQRLRPLSHNCVQYQVFPSGPPSKY